MCFTVAAMEGSWGFHGVITSRMTSNDTLWTSGAARHRSNEKTFHRTHPATSTNEASWPVHKMEI